MKAEALLERARRARRAGLIDDAIAAQEAAIAQMQDPDRRAHALRHLLDMLIDTGRIDRAGPVAAQVEAAYAELACDPLDRANAVRSLACHAEAAGDAEAARRWWLEARDRYAALDARLREMTGQAANPGVAEAQARLRALG